MRNVEKTPAGADNYKREEEDGEVLHGLCINGVSFVLLGGVFSELYSFEGDSHFVGNCDFPVLDNRGDSSGNEHEKTGFLIEKVEEDDRLREATPNECSEIQYFDIQFIDTCLLCRESDHGFSAFPKRNVIFKGECIKK